MANTNHLIDALAKLRWSADGEWSANLKPDECKALLDVLPDEDVTIRTLHAQDVPLPGMSIILSGDPGDEQPE